MLTCETNETFKGAYAYDIIHLSLLLYRSQLCFTTMLTCETNEMFKGACAFDFLHLSLIFSWLLQRLCFTSLQNTHMWDKCDIQKCILCITMLICETNETFKGAYDVIHLIRRHHGCILCVTCIMYQRCIQHYSSHIMRQHECILHFHCLSQMSQMRHSTATLP